MVYPKRIRSGTRQSPMHCAKCMLKTGTFIFWACLYMMVMKLTIFKSSVKAPVEKWGAVPDNYTKWLMEGPILGDDNIEEETKEDDWAEPDNDTVIDLEQRVARVQEVCRAKNLYTQTINSKEFFVDHQHNLVWCNIFKAASSSWLYNFNILGGYTKKLLSKTRHSPLTLARKKFPRPSEEELLDAINTPGVTTFLIVREPFVRLLSAYRDKLENFGPPYYRRLARTIVANHRKEAIKNFGKNIRTFGPTFYEFVAYLIKSHRDKKMEAFDEHWAPFYKFCSLCAGNFTVIGKVETLSRDTAYVVHGLSLNYVLGKRVRDKRTRLRTVMNKSRDGKNTSALLRHYFSEITKNMLNGLLDIYGIDFEMFGYDSSVYFKYVRE